MARLSDREKGKVDRYFDVKIPDGEIETVGRALGRTAQGPAHVSKRVISLRQGSSRNDRNRRQDCARAVVVEARRQLHVENLPDDDNDAFFWDDEKTVPRSHNLRRRCAVDPCPGCACEG